MTRLWTALAGSALAGSAFLLAGCASEPDTAAMMDAGDDAHEGHHMVEVSEREARDKEAAAKDLKARFAVESCDNADLIGTVRRTQAEGGGTLLRAFQASAACGEALTAAVGTLGFETTEPKVFAAGDAEDEAERILIDVAQDGSGTIIEWETNLK